ncbi:MAG: ribosome-binding factor A [Deltaproteobacteria bacterium]|jgi:ribosome-binding factor A|nr:ribosome-binding factor A [Deltaproteobacteria bacterium]
MKNTNDNRRVQRVEKEVQSVLGMYLIHGFSQPLGLFVNVTKVMMAADLRSAKVYISTLPKWNKEELDSLRPRIEKVETEEISSSEEVAELLNQYAFEFQDKISKELKLRYVPKLRFYHDESVDKVIQVDKILTQISTKNDEE